MINSPHAIPRWYLDDIIKRRREKQDETGVNKKQEQAHWKRRGNISFRWKHDFEKLPDNTMAHVKRIRYSTKP